MKQERQARQFNEDLPHIMDRKIKVLSSKEEVRSRSRPKEPELVMERKEPPLQMVVKNEMAAVPMPAVEKRVVEK